MNGNDDTYCKVQFNSSVSEVPKVCSVLLKSYADDSFSDIRFKLNQICSNMSNLDPKKDVEKLAKYISELAETRKNLLKFDDKILGMISILEDVLQHYLQSEIKQEVVGEENNVAR